MTYDAVLLVDGARVHLLDTITIRQGEPFPGGHRFQLTVSGPGIPAVSLLGSDAFAWVEVLRAREVGEAVPPARIVLNSIERLDVSDDLVVMEGACSPVVGDDRASA